MTQPLIGTGLIKKMRKVANRGLQTPVTILSRLPVEENPYGTDTENWVTQGDYLGWVRSVNTASIQELGGDVIGSIGVFRLHLDARVDINPGDLVVIEDAEYVVQDDNHENTYRVFTTATLRRKQ